MKLLIAVAATLLLTSTAFAATPAPLNLCAKGSKITAKAKCAAGERVLNLNYLMGAQGPTGTIDVTKCHKRESTASGAGAVTAVTACLVSEFMVNSGCTTIGIGDIFRHELATGTGGTLGSDVYNVLRCYGWDSYVTSSTYSVVAQAYCCAP